jgi:hypothetical protein
MKKGSRAMARDGVDIGRHTKEVPALKKRMYRREKLSVTRLKKHRHENGITSWAKGGNKVY